MKSIVRTLSPEAKAGAVVALLGFIISISYSTSASTNGVVTSCSYFDLGALIFGGATLALAAKCALNAHTALRHRNTAFVASAVLALIGGLHLVRAFGVVGGAC